MHKYDTGNHPPIRSPAYRVLLQWREAYRKEIQVLLELGIIEPSTSPWASPTVPVKKPDGGLHLCSDYRRLNYQLQMSSKKPSVITNGLSRIVEQLPNRYIVPISKLPRKLLNGRELGTLAFASYVNF